MLVRVVYTWGCERASVRMEKGESLLVATVVSEGVARECTAAPMP